MSGGMYLAAAGALVQQLRLEMVANNVANINTIGFKGEKAVFQLPPQLTEAPPGASPGSVQPLSPYAPPLTAVIDLSPGAIRQTGNPLDVAIVGEGFFAIQTPDGVHYTRQGSFSLDPQGVLVSSEGFPVLGERGELTLAGETVTIDGQGGVHVDGDEVGRLQITAFADPESLKKVGHARFMLADETVAGRRPATVEVQQGALEMSNVDPIRAMTEMIETARAFEAYQKVIQTTDDATSKSIADVGRSQ